MRKELAKGHENQAEIEVVVLDSDWSESHGDTGEDDFSRSPCVSRTTPAFLQKIYDMLENDESYSAVSWSCTGTSFVIKDSHLFTANVLPTYFRHNNFQSFITQLNSYGFKKISWEQCEYRNEYFRKGERNLLRNIKRRDNYSSRIQPTSSRSCSMEKELTTLMNAHRQLKAEIMNLKEKQQILEEKRASFENQAIRNKKDQERMMLVVQRILKKEIDPCSGGVPMLEESRRTYHKNLKGKKKLEAESATSRDSKEKLLLDEEEMARYKPNTFISLDDLIGESPDWVDYVRELKKKQTISNLEL